MSISNRIESKYHFANAQVGHHEARRVSLQFFRRLVEDLTYSEATYVFYVEEEECLYFCLINYDKILRINICGDSLQACTRDIVVQTQAFLSRNERY